MFSQCDRIRPSLVLSKPLPDWLEKRVAEVVEETEIPMMVIALLLLLLLTKNNAVEMP